MNEKDLTRQHTHDHACAITTRFLCGCADTASARCERTRGDTAQGRNPAVLLVSYSTFLPPEWLLGLSAALHGVPLVLVGLGRAWGGHADNFMARCPRSCSRRCRDTQGAAFCGCF